MEKFQTSDIPKSLRIQKLVDALYGSEIQTPHCRMASAALLFKTLIAE